MKSSNGYQFNRQGRVRIRFVDLSRIEASMQEGLSNYELLVRKKLASAPSPDEVLMEAEEEQIKARGDQKNFERILKVVEKNNLCLTQRRLFELLYVTKLSTKEAARVLAITHVRVCQLRKELHEAIKRHLRKEEEAFAILDSNPDVSLRHIAILRAYYQEGLSFAEIGKRYGITAKTVSNLVRKLATSSVADPNFRLARKDFSIVPCHEGSDDLRPQRKAA